MASTEEAQPAPPAASTEEAQPAPPAASTEEAQPAPPAASTEEAQPAPPAASTEEAQPAPPAASTEETKPAPPAVSAPKTQSTPAAAIKEKDETITANEFNDFFNTMHEGDWTKARTMAEKLIERDSPAQWFLIARIRYAYLYTLATAFEKNELSIQDLTTKLQNLQGKLLIQPWHPIKANDVECQNMICNDPQWDKIVFTVQTNRDKKLAYWLEYIDTGKHLDLSSYNGKMARMGGVLRDFSINDELMVTKRSDVDWYWRMNFKDGFILYNR